MLKRNRPQRPRASLRAMACALGFALGLCACQGTTSVKLPDGTTITHEWDTSKPADIYHKLEKFIEENLQYLDGDTALTNPQAMRLAIRNIERASELKLELGYTPPVGSRT